MTDKISNRKKVTLPDLQAKKTNGRKITMLSIPDYPMALLADQAGLDTILVGDSLAMTVLGYETTVPVTIEEMLHHTKAVTRATKYAFVVGDMPFMSNNTSERDAIINAGRFMQEGAVDSVKVEGGTNAAHIVSAIVRAGIPVMGHIGLLPQTSTNFKVKGKNFIQKKQILEDAIAVSNSGVFAIIIECVVENLAKKITKSISVPTIGIGASKHCDGQILVTEDMLGLSDLFPRFVKRYSNLKKIIEKSVKKYTRDVKLGRFPTNKNVYK